MARPLRIEFEGALYHVMARGNARGKIFKDDGDRTAFLSQLSKVAERFVWRVWAYCLMGNHYHLLIETGKPTLSRGMRELNGVYTQAFNRRHRRVGHVLQGRYKAVLVDRDAYLLELQRYIVLNPVRARLCAGAAQWRWSSYRATMGKAPALGCAAVDDTLAMFGAQRSRSRQAYARFVAAGVGAPDPTSAVTAQAFLGDEAFVASAARQARKMSKEIPRRQRAWKTLAQFAREHARDDAIRAAHATGTFTLTAIGAHFGLHYATISRIARASLEDA